MMDPTTRGFALTLMLSGVAAGLGGVVATIAWRKPAVSVRTLLWAGSEAAAHPERYVKEERVAIVRGLNMIGVSLFLLGVLLLVGVSVRNVL